jgi:hypothetical protein
MTVATALIEPTTIPAISPPANPLLLEEDESDDVEGGEFEEGAGSATTPGGVVMIGLEDGDDPVPVAVAITCDARV